MLRRAFNALSLLHSRAAIIKRPGSVDIFTPCRITPSNYFRNLRGPESVNIHGREFIVPVDTLKGQFAQDISFIDVPVAGQFRITYNSLSTDLMDFDELTADIQTEVRTISGLENVSVTGSIAAGLRVVFHGFQNQPLPITITNSTLEDFEADPVVSSVEDSFSAWANGIKRADRIVDSVYGVLTIDEIVEMVDLGGSIMGYRVRCE